MRRSALHRGDGTGLPGLRTAVIAAVACLVLAAPAAGKAPSKRGHASASTWAAAWTAAPQAVYPIGYTVGQPGPIGPAGPGNMGPRLTAAFPDEVANNQTLRMIVRPNVAGRRWRVRLTNVLGTAPVTFDRASVALQDDGAEIVGGTSRTLTFSGRRSVTVAAGDELASDPVRLRVANPRAHSLAISLYLRAPSGPMTWHAASFTTSYITDPNAGDHTGDETEEAFPHSTTSWFFLAGVDVRRRDTATVVAYGDSITDGFFSSINGHDRWPDVLQRRLARRATRSDGRPQLISVANQGIAGNMVTRVGRLPGGCAPCDGPPAVDRLDRDVLSQPGVRAVIFMMGINDLGGGGATAAQVIAGMKDIIRRVHERDIEIIGATLTPSGGTEFGLYGTPATDAARREVNDFIRNGGMFDGVADFSAVTEDPANPGHLRPAYDTHSSVGGPGDHLHPNRAGLLAMGRAVDVAQLEGFVRSDR